jgi:hypothetical protein
VLETAQAASIKIAIPCIHQITSHKESIQVSDIEFDSADTVMFKEPTYSGEGEISEEFFEPHGIDLPTVIYRNAAEAVDLTQEVPTGRYRPRKSINVHKFFSYRKYCEV